MRSVVYALAALALLSAGCASSAPRSAPVSLPTPPDLQPGAATQTAPTFQVLEGSLAGEQVCLTKKTGTTGSCMYGLHADDGKYYSLSFGSPSSTAAEFVAGARFTGFGTFVPLAAVGTSELKEYDVEGIFTLQRKQ